MIKKGLTYKIDIDGVLRDLLTNACEVYNEVYGASILPSDVRDYDFSKTFTECEDCRKFLFEDCAERVMRMAKPLVHALEGLRMIREELDGRIIISTMQYTHMNRLFAIKWLDERNMPYDAIIISKDSNKNDCVCDVIIDDCPAVLKAAKERLKICMRQPYNADCADICDLTVTDWDNLMCMLQCASFDVVNVNAL